ncbi:MAG: FMN-binding glutamate synthase family protein [Pseudopedobacter saltans]|uniref:FMN-binding glutamate synthase family protein n=1 Tax=Pseudopedobacter saltans TaxID=151895 RepID=A0A2W5GL77_9SPHI|nr:MAG: FMN-binding glutamate synthase family protein [Pseudopedobacter saltans]
MSIKNIVIFLLVVLFLGSLSLSLFVSSGFWVLTGLLFIFFAIAIWNAIQPRHSILRNFPLLGEIRYLFEHIRPEMRQYFGESDMNGAPFNRRQRNLIYERAKGVDDTVAFGMQENPHADGHEWVAHSMFPVSVNTEDLRVEIGNEQCSKKYSLSIFNVSAMSYGALSKNAIMALNKGAALGNFAHNTGEGGISSYHQSGGDLIWQIGTAYFGCRDANGHFDEVQFKEQANLDEVKMIEIKLSQGAKPGHGGMLPAVKNTEEIAAIRHIAPHKNVKSPGRHTAFEGSLGLVHFIQKLRELSGGKPIGFKICIGDKAEFEQLCLDMEMMHIFPDFITVDGAEGGTGAAPVEFTDNVGMPLEEALAFVNQTLIKHDLKKHIKIIASGKIISAFDILKNISLGASACNSARGMMIALGCIQALRCNAGTCPVGVATQNPHLYKGLVVEDKQQRIASYHENTLKSVKELMEAGGFLTLEDVNPNKFFKVNNGLTYSLAEYFSFFSLHKSTESTITQ